MKEAISSSLASERRTSRRMMPVPGSSPSTPVDRSPAATRSSSPQSGDCQTTTRRGFLRKAVSGAAVGAGAIAATQLAGAGVANAADGVPLVVGAIGTGSNTTELDRTDSLLYVNKWAFSVFQKGTAAKTTSAGAIYARVTEALTPAIYAQSQGDAVYGESPATAIRGFSHGDSSMAAVYGKGDSGADGVRGQSTHSNGRGVSAYSTASDGVYGESSAGRGLHGVGAQEGVMGECAGGTAVKGASWSGRGVWGQSNSNDGVFGHSETGVGVNADSTSGSALLVTGRAEFSRSGVATISYPSKSATVSVPGPLMSAKTLVLATIQGAGIAGVSVQAASASAGTSNLTLLLNKAPGSSTTPKSVKVGFFVIG